MNVKAFKNPEGTEINIDLDQVEAVEETAGDVVNLHFGPQVVPVQGSYAAVAREVTAKGCRLIPVPPPGAPSSAKPAAAAAPAPKKGAKGGKKKPA